MNTQTDQFSDDIEYDENLDPDFQREKEFHVNSTDILTDFLNKVNNPFGKDEQ